MSEPHASVSVDIARSMHGSNSNGAWVHLGKYDSPTAKAKYKQLITAVDRGGAPGPSQA